MVPSPVHHLSDALSPHLSELPLSRGRCSMSSIEWVAGATIALVVAECLFWLAVSWGVWRFVRSDSGTDLN